jgi:hypothetical protein
MKKNGLTSAFNFGRRSHFQVKKGQTFSVNTTDGVVKYWGPILTSNNERIISRKLFESG